MRRAILLAVLATAVAALAASSARAQIDVNCFSPTKNECIGQWHTRNVEIRWSVAQPFEVDAGCVNGIIDWDTPGERRGCFASTTSGGSASLTVTIKVDRTPPLVGASPARAPDANGWYRNPVTITFAGTDVTSGIAGCTETTYGGPDHASATVAGVCRDRAGNEGTSSFDLRFDATPPAVTTIAPARPPDHGTWYRQPVGFSVGGSDATSGLAGCDPVTYAGPDSAAAVVHGTCRDRAGNVASRAFSVPFDATPPALGTVRTFPADGVVRLDWAAAGASEVEVARSPGRRGEARTVLHRGPGTRLIDRAVRNGRRYEYALTAVDQAGNVATKAIGVTPGPRLLGPPARARLDSPPVLRWTPVRGARYYNVQLFREGRKVLSAWPSRPRLPLRAAWRYRGRQRLEPGRYRWLVWPGEGPRSRNEYGPAIGRRSFVIVPNT